MHHCEVRVELLGRPAVIGPFSDVTVGLSRAESGKALLIADRVGRLADLVGDAGWTASISPLCSIAGSPHATPEVRRCR